VDDRLIGDTVLAGARCDDRLMHSSKLPCHSCGVQANLRAGLATAVFDSWRRK
jgi:hypothetical protein